MPQTSSPEPFLLGVQEVARRTGLSPATLSYWRTVGAPNTPPWIKAGRRVLYPADALVKWAEDRLVSNQEKFT